MRHSRRASPIFSPGLKYFRNLCLHEKRNVPGDFAQRARQQAESSAHLADVVALGMPRKIGFRQPQLLRQRFSNAGPPLSERSKGADGASKLNYNRALRCRLQPLLMAAKGGEPASHFQSQGNRRTFLQPGAAGQDSIGILVDQLDQKAIELLKIVANELRASRICNTKAVSRTSWLVAPK